MKEAWKKAAKAGIGRIRKNARQAFFVLMAMSLFLAGSCRLPERQAFMGPESQAAEIRASLFSNWDRGDSEPAAGYVAQARDFISDEPAVLANLTEREVRLVFGAPRLSRNEGNAGIWQYQSETCTLNVYFGSVKDGPRQVLGFDVWSRTPVLEAGGIVSVEAQDDAACISDVISAPRLRNADQDGA